MLRQLVINADDLGLTAGVNDGIFDAHDLGILTSASVFASAHVPRSASVRISRWSTARRRFPPTRFPPS